MKIYLGALKIKAHYLRPWQQLQAGLALTWLAGCGGREDGDEAGFTAPYDAPAGSYTPPNSADPNFNTLNVEFIQPYWTSSLLMGGSQQVIVPLLSEYTRVIEYSFPQTQPPYAQLEVQGWQPATLAMQVASRQIFENLEEYLNVTFIEVDDPVDMNVVTLGTSYQPATLGFAYFPSIDFEIGMDVFISDNYSDPQFVSAGSTNYDFEILLHEIYHGLGLKHPFHADGDNDSVLSSREATSTYTVMSYNVIPSTFSGYARELDLMALTETYGVNPSFNSEDDVYTFSSASGVFIIDGGGADSIRYDGASAAYVDLRSGAHSYLGAKSVYITSANQLTISAGSSIENAITGVGNDIVIGNALSNIINTGEGEDRIFAGEGQDVVLSGLGADIIDLSEDVQARDIIHFFNDGLSDEADVIYSFAQGVNGDCIDFGDFLLGITIFLPLVDVEDVPSVNISNAVLRVFGSNLDTSEDVVTALATNGRLGAFEFPEQTNAILICADTQNTGAEQRIFAASNSAGDLAVTMLAEFHGNYLDIDQWSAGNFTNFI